MTSSLPTQPKTKNHCLVFSDLDGCLLSTQRKQLAELDACQAVAVSAAGEPNGWQNAKQAWLKNCLHQCGDLVPVTGRTEDGLARCNLTSTSHAIWSHGAGLRLNGQTDKAWQARSLQKLDSFKKVWPEVTAWLRQTPAADARIFPLTDPTLGILGLGVSAPHIEEQAEIVSQFCGLFDLRVETQLDRLTLLPEAIRKRKAVTHILQVLEPEFTIGLGDSLSDVPFLSLCDYVLLPNPSQAFQKLHDTVPQRQEP